MFNPAEFTSLLNSLYQHGLDGFIEIRAFRDKKPVIQRFAKSIREAVQIVIGLPEELDIYFGVNPRSQERGEESDVAYLVCVVADLDFKQFVSPEEARNHALSSGLEPSILVQSGGGLHVYWLLNEPLEDTPRFKETRRKFIRGIKSDAVHDANRILRVPGTANHKYDDHRIVKVEYNIPTNQYGDTSFAKAAELDDTTRYLLAQGGTQGFKSRSERDWHILRQMLNAGYTGDEIRNILEQSPAGDRFRERPGMFEKDLDRVIERVSSPEGEVTIFVQDNAFYAKGQQSSRKISTFVFEPEALMEGEDDDEDIIVGSIVAEGTGHKWSNVSFPKRAFVDRRSFSKYLPVAAWSWLGTDADIVKLLPHLMTTIRERKIPILHGVKTLGRYGTVWVSDENVITPEQTLSFMDSGFSYRPTKREHPAIKYTFPPEQDYKMLVQNIYELLPKINQPDVVWPMIGWFFAAPHKPVLGLNGREFPILQIVGTRTAGKTATVKMAFLPLMGYTEPKTYNCDTTEFVALAVMSSTTSIPIAFSEYRANIPGIERFTRRLRLAYDLGVDLRGRSDQTTVSYPLSAPISIDGEDPIEDSAVQERSVVIRFNPEILQDRDSPYRDPFYDLTELPLSDFAGRYIQYTLAHEPQYEQAYKLVSESLNFELTDRVLANLTKVTVGLLNYVAYGKIYEASVPEITPEFIREEVYKGWFENMLLGNTGRTRTALDTFVEDVVNEVARSAVGFRMRDSVMSTDPFIWRINDADNELALHLATAYDWWVRKRRSIGQHYLSSASLKAQLRERTQNGRSHPGQYVKDHRSVGMLGGRSFPAYVIDLEELSKCGLDVPTSLRLVGVKLGGTREGRESASTA